ncbi:unnamed protein product [Danaus chrysippus]|uniref:(African queen) hypothetical protein n=1 Tax=Danaus chrysippus TaxID=151541 RepID=A0A8J2VW55_9NEOP|nr:unnamed protein product [Danaus chrysippus]
MANVVEVLIHASEKAASIARSCTISGSETLLVSEKSETEANKRFDKDYKTIADVLAQETAKALITAHFPQLVDHVRGEECAEINGVKISLQNNVKKTAEMLGAILPQAIAHNMAEAAHKDVSQNLPQLPSNLPVMDPAEVGIWIDPIDGTAEFIAGIQGEAKPGHGLPCVTVLIGAYLRSSGKPILGVINQPFYDNGKGRIIWGLNYADKCKWSHENNVNTNKVILMSSAEKPEIVEKFKSLGWEVKSVPGAGHKLLKVAIGEASAYIVSQGTTFRWDTCAPHAILLAKGGNVLNYTDYTPLTYNDQKDLEAHEYCNKNGIIAYDNNSILEEIKDILNSV